MSSWTFYNENDKNWGKWIYNAVTEGAATVLKTEEQVIDEILGHPDLEDKGFFEDMVAWIRRDAPKKLRTMLGQLHPFTTGLGRASADLSYGTLCKVVYGMGFRASEVLERRMILGPSNEWARRYFEDFAPK